MKPGAYLAGLAGARSVYLWMFKAAVGLIPPPQVGKTFPLECHRSIRDIAAELEQSSSTVRESLIQLEHYGWITGRRAPRLMGHREGAKFHLLADLATEQVVGQQGIVSRLVLRLGQESVLEKIPSKNRGAETPSGRGTGREWDGGDDWTWGEQKK